MRRPDRPGERKGSELSSEERRLANFVDFIGEGRGSHALANALRETERRVEALREELAGLLLRKVLGTIRLEPKQGAASLP